ncbi:MAG: hypothetical protein ABIP79_02425 [Chitinophagaceae bacterium]
MLYPFPWLHPFEVIDHTRLITLNDIIPMKLQAISNRFAKKDFWDIDFLLNEISLEKMIAIFDSKFPLIDTGYIIHSLTNFEAADDEDDPVCLIHRKWEEIKLNLAEKVKGYTANFL